ncbi:MAG: AzlD domain-containing protein [Deltaproteobacteria bacterium]|jgi:branched-subunit amino acid transport protein|nr:AzlD domain-containing protein [Deltaproteobacteria bacterium]
MNLNYFLAVGLAALGTFLLRAIFLAAQEPPSAPKVLEVAMDFVPIAVLSALVFQEFFVDKPLLPSLGSALVALVLALTLGKDILTIAGGLLAYFIFTGLI